MCSSLPMLVSPATMWVFLNKVSSDLLAVMLEDTHIRPEEVCSPILVTKLGSPENVHTTGDNQIVILLKSRKYPQNIKINQKIGDPRQRETRYEEAAVPTI